MDDDFNFDRQTSPSSEEGVSSPSGGEGTEKKPADGAGRASRRRTSVRSAAGGRRKSRRASTVSRSQGFPSLDDMERTKSEQEEPPTWREPLRSVGVVWRRLKRRIRAFRLRMWRSVKKEVRQNIGNTATSRAILYLMRNHPDRVRANLWVTLLDLKSKLFGSDTKAAEAARMAARAAKGHDAHSRDQDAAESSPQDGGRKRRQGMRIQTKRKSQIDTPGFGIGSFIINNPGNIEDFFFIHGEIGTGGSSKVYKATEIATGAKRAIKKIIKRSASEMTRYFNEMTVMKKLDHVNIIKLFETFEDDDALFLVMELCEGGDVLDKLLSAGVLDESQAAVVVRAGLNTLNYLHHNGYMHRDMKPENIVFKDNRLDYLVQHLKVVDFGFACKLPASDDIPIHTKIGTPLYVAPEVLDGNYTCRADIWSVGIICYITISGYPPFFGETDAETIRAVKKGRFYFHADPWDMMPKSLKHFVRKLLEVDPEQRMTIEEALEHPWLKHRARGRVDMIREETVDRLVCYSRYHVLRRAAMLAVAYQMETEDTKMLVELFRGLDLNGDGVLTRDEFVRGVRAIGVEADLIKLMVQSVDADHSGVIDFTEFLAATLEKSMYISRHDVILRAFRTFDQDDSGMLSSDEIAETLEMQHGENYQEIQRIYSEVIMNEDGVIDYGEFYNMLSEELSTLSTEEAAKQAAKKEKADEEKKAQESAESTGGTPKSGKAVKFGEEGAEAEEEEGKGEAPPEGADGSKSARGKEGSPRAPVDAARARALFMAKRNEEKTADDDEEGQEASDEEEEKQEGEKDPAAEEGRQSKRGSSRRPWDKDKKTEEVPQEDPDEAKAKKERQKMIERRKKITQEDDAGFASGSMEIDDENVGADTDLTGKRRKALGSTASAVDVDRLNAANKKKGRKVQLSEEVTSSQI